MKCPCCYTDMLLVLLDVKTGKEIFKCPHCGYEKHLELSTTLT